MKTPLTAIRMFAETMLLNPIADQKVRDDYLETIVNETERLTRLLNNVLDFSKIEREERFYRLAPAALSDVVRGVVRAVQHPLEQQSVDLKVEVDDRRRHR